MPSMALCASYEAMRARIAVLLIVSMLLVSCSEEMVSDSRIAMGTLVAVSIPRSEADSMDGIFSLVYSIDHAISRYDPGSYISAINRSAGIAPVTVPEDVFSLISDAVDMAYATDGVFNPAIGPLSELWGFGTEKARLPSSEEIEAVLPLLDYTLIQLDGKALSVYLPVQGMSLDLGAVGKGYASDAIHSFLEENGIDHAVINLGGNVLVHGSHPDGRPWKVSVRDPDPEKPYIAALEADDGTVITSGGYQRYFEEDGIVYHHILDSSTGYPVETDVLSATVVNPSGTLGDMLSTVLFAERMEKGIQTAEGYGVDYILLLEDGSVISSLP